MNAVPVAHAKGSWPWHRWALFIGLVFAIHIGLLFALGNRKPIVRRAVVNAPVLQLTVRRSEREQLDDPTLFALPHPNGFAGAAWIRRPRLEFAPFRWTEPPRLLALSGENLGVTFLKHRETNRVARLDLELEILPPSGFTPLNPVAPTLLTNRNSRASLGGEVTKRKWLNAPTDLPPQRAADILTNTVVQVWVGTDGRVFSPTLLLPGSGSKDADQLALKLARAAQFAPLAGAAAQLTRGTLIFEWHTLPLASSSPVTP